MDRDLPEDCMEIIMSSFLDRLDSFEDYLQFSKCSYFRGLVREKKPYQKPWVMLPNKPGDKTRPFYSPLEGKIYNIHLPKVVRRSWCCGSYQGWLMFAHKTRGNFAYNPVTRLRFTLPTHQVEHKYSSNKKYTDSQHITNCSYFIQKVALSTLSPSTSSSSGPRLAAAAITDDNKLLVTLCGPSSSKNNNKWHSFCPLTLEEEGLLSFRIPYIYDSDDDDDEEEDQEEEVELKSRYGESDVRDIIFYKGEFHAVNRNGKLIVIKALNDHDFLLKRVSGLPLKLKRKERGNSNINYLVESCNGELLMIVRVRIRDWKSFDDTFKDRKLTSNNVARFITKKFLVFRLDESDGLPFRWVRMESLGDQVLFLGKNYSKSVQETGGSRNCIYFTDDNRFNSLWTELFDASPYKDSGVYHLEDGRMDKLLPSELEQRLYTFKRQPIIFTPNPWVE